MVQASPGWTVSVVVGPSRSTVSGPSWSRLETTYRISTILPPPERSHPGTADTLVGARSNPLSRLPKPKEVPFQVHFPSCGQARSSAPGRARSTPQRQARAWERRHPCRRFTNQPQSLIRLRYCLKQRPTRRRGLAPAPVPRIPRNCRFVLLIEPEAPADTVVSLGQKADTCSRIGTFSHKSIHRIIRT